MIQSTFQLVPGLGPTRERQLWHQGIATWSSLRAQATWPLPRKLHEPLGGALVQAEAAMAAGDLPALARLIPGREAWRLYPSFIDRAVFLDIETDQEDGVTAIGILDAQGPRLFLAGRNLDDFQQHVTPDRLLVTFNGSSFDVPVLRRAFPDWVPPAAHIDLRHLWTRLGFWGGLKAIEVAVGIGRPDHLRELDGSAAAWMWRHYRRGDQRALRRFAEYNLYDAINLRTLLDMGYNRMVDELALEVPRVTVSGRGDVLYDVTKILMAL